MIDINREQYKMLCRIKKSDGLPQKSLSENDIQVCYYWLEHNCISEAQTYPSPPYINRPPAKKRLPSTIEITQTGKAQIYIFRTTFHKWWIPLAVSIASFTLSVISLIRSMIL